MIDIFTRHPLTSNPEIELNEILLKYEEQSTMKKSNVTSIFASLRQMLDDREKYINEKLSDTDVQNKKRIEDYQEQLMNKYKRVQERYILFKQVVAAGEHITVLRDHQTYENHLNIMMDEWSKIEPPKFIEFNIDGLEQMKTTMVRSIEEIRFVEQVPYENSQLEELILRQQGDPTLNLNNQGLNDFDTIIIARTLRTNVVNRLAYTAFILSFSVMFRKFAHSISGTILSQLQERNVWLTPCNITR